MSVNRMFLARTHDDKMFEGPDKETKEGKEDLMNGIKGSFKREINKHRVPKLSTKDRCCLLLSHCMGCFFPSCLWGKHKKLKKLFEEG